MTTLAVEPSSSTPPREDTPNGADERGHASHAAGAQQSPWWRRLWRFLAVLLALTTVNTALEVVNRAAFPTVTTTGVVHSDKVNTELPNTYWVFFPGFGINFCSDVERAFAPVTGLTGRSFCVAPSTARLDPAEIAAAVQARVAEHRDPGRPVTLYLYGISMGGMIAYDVARQLDGQDGVVVRAVLFDSSPAGPDSVSADKRGFVALGATINRLPDLPWGIPNPLKGGPLNRALVHIGEEMIGDLRERRLPSGLDDLRSAWYKATSVTSGGMANQFDYIQNFYPTPDPEALPYASFAYLRAQDAGADTTVDVQRATDTYAALIAPRRLTVLPVVGGTHASGDVTVQSYRAALSTFITEAGLPTADDTARIRHVERGTMLR
ncbi:hypothetical protein SAMN05421595_2346 [Austwickia chelonae]|uniref:Thioesterase domain-containing protein n=1 Tax=Austwickia chelonae NBRC 105200 TaxID=1184607 RepID=K6WA28_9MICO|nr:thioesterase domain-containing protein [Austwickia chelonae]GAB78692.1 hypothetical protein AUCHE_16_01120 [Austwickia chelonae NBRC 105200]SEW34765.1 hypothetical protein SAMN05421595_2346 [Austwickia chelonae]